MLYALCTDINNIIGCSWGAICSILVIMQERFLLIPYEIVWLGKRTKSHLEQSFIKKIDGHSEK